MNVPHRLRRDQLPDPDRHIELGARDSTSDLITWGLLHNFARLSDANVMQEDRIVTSTTALSKYRDKCPRGLQCEFHSPGCGIFSCTAI